MQRKELSKRLKNLNKQRLKQKLKLMSRRKLNKKPTKKLKSLNSRRSLHKKNLKKNSKKRWKLLKKLNLNLK